MAEDMIERKKETIAAESATIELLKEFTETGRFNKDGISDLLYSDRRIADDVESIIATVASRLIVGKYKNTDKEFTDAAVIHYKRKVACCNECITTMKQILELFHWPDGRPKE
jgi:hypothetical protein